VTAISPERLTAYHEAGHALASVLYGQVLTRVEIVGDAEHSGSTETLRFPADPDEGGLSRTEIEAVENQLRCVLAGMVAEAMVVRRNGWDESSGDLDEAVRLAMKLVDDCEDVLPLLEDLREDLEKVLSANWQSIEVLADRLMDRKSLSGAEVRRLLESSRSD
jgi:ATP-dependent Zn protease